MGNKAVLVLLLLAAAALVFWLLGGADLFTSDPGDVEDGGGASSGGTLTTEEEAGPVLFGRGREQRVGVGGLMGRVMEFRTGKPVGGARVVTTGTGYGEEAITLQVSADANGNFQYEEVPAGDAYRVHVTGDDRMQRTVEGVSVEADDVADLGTLWLGKAAVLEGVVADRADSAIAGARVEVHRGGSLLAMLQDITKFIDQLDKDAKPLVVGTTGDDGRFRIEGVAPGPMMLVVRAPGYRQRMHEIVMTSKGAAGGVVQIRLDAARPLVGVVVDETDRPIEGARVALMAEGDMRAALFGRLFTRTDEEGRFRIESPPTQGTLAVIAAAEGYPTLFGEAEPGTELRLVLRGGARVTVRLVEKDTGRGIEGATLMAMFAEKAGLDNDDMSYAAGDTDHRGEAVFNARPGVLGMLFFSHPEHGSGAFSPALPSGMLASVIEGPEDVKVKKPSTTLVFKVQKGITISGRVLDADGNAIPGARVSSLGGMGLGAKVRADAEGRYVLRGQTPSVQMVIARSPGYVQENPMLQGAEPDGRGEIEHDIVMLRAATVTGRVLGPDGVPLAGVRVKLGSQQASTMVAAFMGGSGQSITSSDGRYVLADVAAGDKMYVMARIEGYLDGRSAEFKVKAGQAVKAPDLTMQRGARFRVKVLAPDQTPVAAARVEVTVEDKGDQIQWDPQDAFGTFADVTTNEDGVVTLEDIPDGGLTLTVGKAGFASARSSLKINRKHVTDDTEVTVTLREAVRVKGRVVGPDDKPVAQATVISLSPPNVKDEHWVPTVQSEADAEGRFQVPGMPECPLVLEVSAAGFSTKEVRVEDARAEVLVELEAISADALARLEEIKKELMGLYAKFANVKNEAERNAMIERMRALQQEQAELVGKGK